MMGERLLFIIYEDFNYILVHYKYTLMNDNTERNTNQFE